MNPQILYPTILVVSGILMGTLALILLNRVSNYLLKLFQLYPESKSILKISLKAISWFLSLTLFLLFLRLALKMIGLDFTTMIVENLIKASPRYIIAITIILLGFYVSRAIKDKARNYEFEFKNQLILLLDFIVHMTFILTALSSIGINIIVFIEVYKVFLWMIGAIFALIISMVIGIPLGISIYNRSKKRKSEK